MARWTVGEPTTLEFDGVVALRATLIAGTISVLATEQDQPSVLVSEISGPPLLISHEAGMLTVTHERIWDSVVSWLRTQEGRAALTVVVPRECPVSVTLGTADAIITGLAAPTAIKSAAGDVALDGVTGRIDVNTVSGAVEAQGVDGAVNFISVSGDLTVAGGAVDRLGARTVSGKVTADVDLVGRRRVSVSTVSGEVALRLPESVSARVSLTSAAGRIDTSFAGLARQERAVAKAVTGTLGDGDGRLTVSTVSGGVTLLGRPPGGTAETGQEER